MKGSLCKENCIMCPCIFVGQELPSDSSSIKMFGEDSHSFFFLILVISHSSVLMWHSECDLTLGKQRAHP